MRKTKQAGSVQGRVSNLVMGSARLALGCLLTATAWGATPVAWGKLDDNAANATVADSSGNNRTGTFYSGIGTPQNTSVAHHVDRAEGSGSLIFDGINDFVTVPGYKGITGGGSRTCAAWMLYLEIRIP